MMTALTPNMSSAQALSLIRTQYLQARSPLQIKELKYMLEKNTETKRGAKTDSVTSSPKDRENDLSSIRKNCTINDFPTHYTKHVNMSTQGAVLDGKGDLDKVGNRTELDEKLGTNIDTTTATSGGSASSAQVEVGGNGTSCEQGSWEKCASSSIIISNPKIQGEVLNGLYGVTIGYPPPHLATDEGELRREDGDEQTFLHPPIQYQIAFAKYIIKQLELSGNWSVPQGSNEEDKGDPVEQESLLLEKWYDGLESLSSSTSSRQHLSEPFYRLYEIKAAHHNRKGSSGNASDTTATRSNWKNGIVKIFEHETSFVADGTTGLVTWKASTEFLKWLTSQQDDGGKWLLERFGEGKQIEWILELGCGCGFLATALNKCIPAILQQYIATDGSLAALEKAKLNIDANFSERDSHEKIIKERIRFEKVEWQNEETRESFTQLVDGMACIYGENKGLLLGTDIVFDPALTPDLVALIADFLAAKAGKVILACTIRNEMTLDHLKEKLGKHHPSAHLNTRICGVWEDGEILDIST